MSHSNTKNYDSVETAMEKIVQVYERIMAYFFDGMVALKLLETIYAEELNAEEFSGNKKSENDILIVTMVGNALVTAILVLANLLANRINKDNRIMKDKSSIHISYLMNLIRASKQDFPEETSEKLLAKIDKFENELDQINDVTENVKHLRDTCIAHVDRKQINNPESLTQGTLLKRGDINNAFSVIYNGLREIGEDLPSDFDRLFDVYEFSINILVEKTKQVFKIME